MDWKDMVHRQIGLWEQIQSDMNAVPWKDKTYYHKRRWVESNNAITLMTELLSVSDQNIRQVLEDRIEKHTEIIRQNNRKRKRYDRDDWNRIYNGELRKNYEYILYAITGVKPDKNKYNSKKAKVQHLEHLSKNLSPRSKT